ncbi:MAG TPA: hypothetical protein VJ227_03390 [Patescibacteria group bacterium]|nr:hypothetical protein [Patescibacteria group bacterium]
MIPSILAQILGLAGITYFGLLIVNFFMPNSHFLERISSGFLVGLGIFTFVLFLTSWFLGLPFAVYPAMAILFWLILLSVFLSVLFKRKLLPGKSPTAAVNNILTWYGSLSVLEKGVVWLVVFIFFSVLVNNLYWPIWMWDAIALYDFRAKSIVSLGRVVGSFGVSNGTYPLLTSISHGLVYLFGGTNPQYLYFLFFLSLSLIFYHFLRKFLARKYSLITLLFLITIPLLIQQSQVTLTDLPQSAYLVPGFLYMILGLASGKKSYIALSSIFFSLSSWVRNEPFWAVGFFVLLILSFKRKWFILDGLYLFVIYLVHGVWSRFITLFSPPVTQAAGQGGDSTSFWGNYVNPTFWIIVGEFVFKNIIYPIWPIFLAMLILIFARRKRLSSVTKIALFSTISTFLFFVMGASVYIISYSEWQALYSSLQRILIFFDVLVVTSISLLLFPHQKKTGQEQPRA